MAKPLDHAAGERDDSPYDENGVDRSLVRWMLSLSPTERLAQVQSSIDLVMSVRAPSDGAR
ncbi:hypothetical protein [Sorangium sp. So ce1153]|uniref:hypothetical protein n=1 Tax=Sorangium sp. So ce1153 TaxID=3133333 RepID=UPI003F5D6ABE